MIRYYKTIEDKLEKLNSYEHGCWVNLVEPTNEEIFELSNILDLDIDSINAALDEEERSRIEVEDNHTLILIDIPIDESSSSSAHYSTIPLGIILMDECIVTVCTAQSRLLNDFIVGHIKEFFTYKKTRFILQILYKNATYYLLYLRRINKLTIEIEREIHNSMKNKELLQKSYAGVAVNIDWSKLKEGVSPNTAIAAVTWLAEGFVREVNSHGLVFDEKIYSEFDKYIELLRTGIYNPENGG